MAPNSATCTRSITSPTTSPSRSTARNVSIRAGRNGRTAGRRVPISRERSISATPVIAHRATRGTTWSTIRGQRSAHSCCPRTPRQQWNGSRAPSGSRATTGSSPRVYARSRSGRWRRGPPSALSSSLVRGRSARTAPFPQDVFRPQSFSDRNDGLPRRDQASHQGSFGSSGSVPLETSSPSSRRSPSLSGLVGSVP